LCKRGITVNASGGNAGQTYSTTEEIEKNFMSEIKKVAGLRSDRRASEKRKVAGGGITNRERMTVELTQHQNSRKK